MSLLPEFDPNRLHAWEKWQRGLNERLTRIEVDIATIRNELANLKGA